MASIARGVRMLDRLVVVNLKKGTQIPPHGGEVFTLSTCQRTLIVGHGLVPFKYIETTDSVIKTYHGSEGYQFLLETILGLQSEVVAEYEVVNQFKETYKQYLQLSDRNSHIISVLEKLFKDQKQVRSEHLMEVGQLSYAGIARKLIHSNSNAQKILIIGSGKLALDLINLLKKKYQIHISARNRETVAQICKSHGTKSIPWLDKESYLEFPFIINTIGAHEVLFDEEFFSNWIFQNFNTPSKLFIDLGSPSVLNTHYSKEDGVLRLEDIFNESVKLGREKMEKVENAKVAARELTSLRHQNFSISIPFGWEELQFA